MTEEVQVQEEQQQDDDAGFEAGFAGARGEELPTPEPVAEEQPAETPEPVAEPEPEPIVFAGLTESQVKAKLVELDEAKAQVRQLHGRYGELNSRLSQIQQSHAAGQPVALTAEMFEELNADFPELAQSIVKGLSKVTLQGSGPSFDPTPMREEIRREYQSEVERMRQETEIKLLRSRHRDWQKQVHSDDFKLWKSTLAADDQQTLDNTWDSDYIGDRLDEFKEWKRKAGEQKQQKTNRLAAAVTPKGNPAPANTINDEDAFMSGFKAIRR